MPRMKLPRWLVIGMLTTSVLAVLAAAGWYGWWWVTWPERTASLFVAHIEAGENEELSSMLRNMTDGLRLEAKPGWFSFFFHKEGLSIQFPGPQIVLLHRDLRNILNGRQAMGLFFKGGKDSGVRFYASRDTVTCEWESSSLRKSFEQMQAMRDAEIGPLRKMKSNAGEIGRASCRERV